MNDFQRATIDRVERELRVSISSLALDTPPESLRDVELETASSHSQTPITRPTGVKVLL